MPNDYLDNARDWLLIACYTGQRISDYLNFTSSMIITDEDGISYIEFSQKKTNTKMRLPILSKVSEILDKRNGEFPRRISEQKLNKYITPWEVIYLFTNKICCIQCFNFNFTNIQKVQFFTLKTGQILIS